MPAPGSPLGSDSHAVIDLFEEARAVELDERLATGERGRHEAAALLAAASAGGPPASAGPTRAESSAGALRDLVAIGLDGVRLAGTDRSDPVPLGRVRRPSADVRQ